MNLLLDTHAFIWFMEGDSSLPKQSRKAISDIRNNCFISIASLWEMAIKFSLGNLKLAADFNQISSFLEDNQIEVLPVAFNHLQKLLILDYHHRDPFDRIIISQALSENLIIISKDENFSKYTKSLLW